MKFKLTARLAVIAAFAVFGVDQTQAATRTWISTSGAIPYWQTNIAWSGSVAPVAGDDLLFNIPVAGGTRTMTNDFAANTAFNGIRISASAFVFHGNAINLAGNVTNSSGNPTAINLNLALQQNTVFSIASGTRIDMNGDISGNFGINKTDLGTLRIQNTGKTYTGDSTISAGTLDINVTDGLAFGAGKGNVIVSSGATFGVRAAQNINGLSGAGTVSALNSGTKTITLGNGDANGNFSGVIQNGSGAIALTKTGTGKQILSGANTYTGITSVNGGTLQVDGTSAGAGAFTVAAAATLAGNGGINASTTITGQIAPGASIGTLSFSNNLTLGALSTTTMELDRLNAQNADFLNIALTLNLGGTLNVLNIGTALQGGDTFDLFNATTVTLSYGTVNLPSLDPGLTWDTSLLNTTGVISVNAVPEPTTTALACLGGLALLLAIKRRK